MNSNAMTRILVVDDDPTIRKLVELVLTQAGYQVTLAATGEQGFSLASQQSFDMAVLDVMLPGMDGYTLCRRLRAHPRTSLIPILMLTAQAETRDKLAGFNAGADDYVTKPFEPAEFVVRVKVLLARSAVMTAPAPAKPAQHGKIWAVFGAKGGVGKTTLAVNLAVALARQPNVRVILVDADFEFGDVGAHLNLSPSRTILDLLPRIDELDEELISRVLLRHDSNVRVLLGPYRPEDAERIQPEVLTRIIHTLAGHADYVIVDCAANYSERTLVLLENADQILMILTPEIGPVKNTSTFLELAGTLGIPETRIQIVLNRANSEVGIAAQEVERALNKTIPARLMSGGRPVVLSVNRGIPLLLAQPQHPFAQQVVRVAELLRANGSHAPH
jgi:pilus assembly protein CpaE